MCDSRLTYFEVYRLYKSVSGCLKNKKKHSVFGVFFWENDCFLEPSAKHTQKQNDSTP